MFYQRPYFYFYREDELMDDDIDEDRESEEENEVKALH